MGGHGTETEVRSTNKISGIYSNKKNGNAKIGKTQKKLPDLNTVGYNEHYYKKPVGGGFATDTEDYLNTHNQQLPMINGGNIHAQNMADSYVSSNNNQGSRAIVIGN